jgi:REP element-mobilizing transposase RayT
MVTWRTYGTWLQGHEKGYVRRGERLGENVAIRKDCEKKMTGKPVRLNRMQKELVREAFAEAGKKYGQRLLATAVQSNHVHMVCAYSEVPVRVMVARYKSAGRAALALRGVKGKIWAAGYYREFRFDAASLADKIRYVEKHGE